MAVNDIKVPKENAQGTFNEIALTASDLKLGTTANLPVKTGTSGVIEAGAFGTEAGSFCEGNDARIANIAANTISADGSNWTISGVASLTSGEAYGAFVLPDEIAAGGPPSGMLTTMTMVTLKNDARIVSIQNNSINTLSQEEGGAGGTLEMQGADASDEGVNGQPGGSINTSRGGGSISTRGTGSIELGIASTRTTLTGTATEARAISLPNASGTIALTSLVGASAELVIACSDETSNLTTGTAKVTFRMPYAMTLSSVRASVNTAPTGSTLVVDINEGGSTILSTKLSIDASELTSTTAATAAVISDTALADDAEITIDVDQIGSTIAGKGLKVVLKGTRA
jgi:hypothetical protein